MSANAEAPATVDASRPDPDLEELAQSLKAVRQELIRKIENGRVRDEAKERVRVKQARTLAYVVSEERKLKKVRELEDLRDEVDEIKAERDPGV